MASEPAAQGITEAASKSIRVFIVAGQSNAVGFNHTREYKKGRSEFPKELQHQKDVLFWSAATEGTKGSWDTLRVASKGSFGPEIRFARDMKAALPGVKIAIIKCASGGTGIARSRDYSDYIPALKGFDDRGKNWHPPSKAREAGKLYRKLIRNVRDAMAALERDEKKAELAGCVWMQGEHEAGISRKMAEDYERLLTDFMKSVRKDLDAPSLTFAIGQINSHKWAFGDIARTGQANVCRKDSSAILVKTIDLSRAGSGGASHFDADGTLELGSRFANVFVRRQSGDRLAE